MKLIIVINNPSLSHNKINLLYILLFLQHYKYSNLAGTTSFKITSHREIHKWQKHHCCFLVW